MLLYAIRISEPYLPKGCKWPRYNYFWLQKEGVVSKDNGHDVLLYRRKHDALKDIKKYKKKSDEREWEIMPIYIYADG